MADRRPFTVEVDVLRTSTFIVDARSPEEAVSTAEQWIADGETGAEISYSIERSEASPAEEFGDAIVGGTD